VNYHNRTNIPNVGDTVTDSYAVVITPDYIEREFDIILELVTNSTLTTKVGHFKYEESEKKYLINESKQKHLHEWETSTKGVYHIPMIAFRYILRKAQEYEYKNSSSKRLTN